MSDLDRFGLEWTSATDFIAKPMDDGYWTPWHIAHSELTAARDEVERLRGREAMQADGICAAIDYIGSFCVGFPRVTELLDALEKVRIAGAGGYLLLAQADAVEEILTFGTHETIAGEGVSTEDIWAFAQRLRQQADDIERGGVK